jgi:L-fuconolactonase
MPMAIDTHVHFWQLERGDPIGVNRRIAGLERDFDSAELARLAKPVGVTNVVLVQAAASVAETRYLLGLARTDPFVAAVIGWVDIELPELGETLSGLTADGKFAGVRLMVADVKTADWLARPSVRHGIAILAERDLVVELLVRPTQLADAGRLLREMPRLRVNINHCARPLIVAREWQPWASLMSDIAREPTTICKFSGLIERGGFEWSVNDLKPYVSHLLEAFGAERLMFASNWPIINLVGTYRRWWDAANDVLDQCGVSAADKDAIFTRTAARFYRL